MAEFLKLDQYPADVLWILTFLIIGGGTVVGYITDAVMGNRGFGPIGNGVLVIMGALIGVHVRNAYFGLTSPGDIAITAIFAAAAATLLLMLLGVAKHWVQD
jgi:hypothetical protein